MLSDSLFETYYDILKYYKHYDDHPFNYSHHFKEEIKDILRRIAQIQGCLDTMCLHKKDRLPHGECCKNCYERVKDISKKRVDEDISKIEKELKDLNRTEGSD